MNCLKIWKISENLNFLFLKIWTFRKSEHFPKVCKFAKNKKKTISFLQTSWQNVSQISCSNQWLVISSKQWVVLFSPFELFCTAKNEKKNLKETVVLALYVSDISPFTNALQCIAMMIHHPYFRSQSRRRNWGF